MSDEEAAGVLDDLDAAPERPGLRVSDADAQDVEILRQLDRDIARRVAASRGDDGHLPLVRLSRICQWTSFEAQSVVIALAPELDRRYEKLCGYLQDDVTRKRPTVALTLDLLCAEAEATIAARLFFDPQAPLFRDDVLRIGHGPEDSPLPLLSRPLLVDDRIVEFLLGRQRLDARLGDAVRLVMPDEAGPAIVDDTIERRIEHLIEASDEAADGGRRNTVFYLHGAAGSGRRALAEAVCRRLRVPLVVADLERLLASPSPADATRRLAREAMLLPAALCIEHVDALIDDPAKSALHLRPLLRACRSCSRLTFLIGRRSWLPPEVTSDEPFFSVQVKLPELGASPGLWESLARMSGAPVAGDVDWGSLASRFRLGPTQIRDVLVVAGDLARWRTPSAPQITMSDLSAACRTIGASRLTTLSRKVDGVIRWDDLILPPNAVAQLRELCDHATYRHVVLGQWGFESKLPLGRGLSALFCGPPGTGKTMAAQVIAGELGLDLYRIDLSQVVSKYIGETEKNLRHVFDEAEATHAILFFDEADALFGKRSEVKDAHDRYANIEVGYLLQKMEEFEGIAILATNVRRNLDEAFVRRLRFIVEFRFPTKTIGGASGKSRFRRTRRSARTSISRRSRAKCSSPARTSATSASRRRSTPPAAAA